MQVCRLTGDGASRKSQTSFWMIERLQRCANLTCISEATSDRELQKGNSLNLHIHKGHSLQEGDKLP